MAAARVKMAAARPGEESVVRNSGDWVKTVPAGPGEESEGKELTGSGRGCVIPDSVIPDCVIPDSVMPGYRVPAVLQACTTDGTEEQ
ncbi:unnamed protein product [Rangifer tarandus platyrhynchus]|uniref:Uncharacterized protein n=2 Tax=Rangifer tarandus platyrhynchus TaxID=3082113 RepID=A0ABN9A3G6_RANTA|nr:unnamed protein product [Rangifer tarandus platyrhynchus]CAI9712152.1 unnamed protein product [Rangifer tarandus platyrhynchus]